MSPGGWLDLINDDSPALRATFFGPTPSPSQMYWRGPVLPEFDGRPCTRSRWLKALPPAPVTPAPPTWGSGISLAPTGDHQIERRSDALGKVVRVRMDDGGTRDLQN